jgi:hypothetical protein
MIDAFDLRDDAEGDDAGCKDSDAETEFSESKDVVIGRADCNAEGVDATEESGYNSGIRTCQIPRTSRRTWQ